MIDDELRSKIKEHHNKGQGSIQDIARVYRVSVAEVLTIIGASELTQVEIAGDLIDPGEAGPGANMNYGMMVPIPFTTD
jgi:hypothetical protein